MAAWGFSPDLSSWNYKEQTTYISTNKTKSVHKHIWEIWTIQAREIERQWETESDAAESSLDLPVEWGGM